MLNQVLFLFTTSSLAVVPVHCVVDLIVHLHFNIFVLNILFGITLKLQDMACFFLFYFYTEMFKISFSFVFSIKYGTILSSTIQVRIISFDALYF